jgi:hypothetical protein
MQGLRGRALVQQVVDELPPGRWRSKREPLAHRVVSSLRLDSGELLPASLATWLEFDTLSPEGDVLLVRGKRKPRLAVRSMAKTLEETVVAESLGEEWEDDTREAMNELAAGFPGDVLLLREPSGQDLMLYLGRRDEDGEGLVLAMEHEQLWVAYPGFDFYVADQVGASDVKALPDYARRMEKAAALCGLGKPGT